MFSNHTRLEMGDGFKIRFWHDVWCGKKALKEAFPDLYNIAHVKDASVAVHSKLSNGSIQWSISFIRVAHNRWMSLLCSLICCISML
jgi:hypothetical protein